MSFLIFAIKAIAVCILAPFLTLLGCLSASICIFIVKEMIDLIKEDNT